MAWTNSLCSYHFRLPTRPTTTSVAPVITTKKGTTKLLDNKTIDGLYALKLPAMAAGLAEQRDQAPYQALSFEERLGLLVDKELTEREDRRVGRYLKSAKLRTGAVIEDIDFHRQRGLERSVVLGLAGSGWVKAHHNLTIVGPTGAGKTFLACALANSAVRNGYTALYLRAPRMLDELAIARADGRFPRVLATWARTDVLLIDDFLLRPLTPDQAADILEVVEDRAGLRSTVLTSQLPVAMWHDAIGEPTLADAVLDRLLENLQRVELDGESLRQERTESADGAHPDAPPAGASTLIMAKSRSSDPSGRPVWPYEALNAPGRTQTAGLRPGKTHAGHLRTNTRSPMANCRLETAEEVNFRA